MSGLPIYVLVFPKVHKKHAHGMHIFIPALRSKMARSAIIFGPPLFRVDVKTVKPYRNMADKSLKTNV
jgi:hypothetical protein